MNLLVADPHRENSDWIQDLHSHDFILNIVENGEEVMDAIQSQIMEYDAVLINGVLPDMLGHTLASFIKKIYPNLSVFVVTRDSNMELWREVSKSKAQMLPLPIDVNRLLFILDQQPKQPQSIIVQREVAAAIEEAETFDESLKEVIEEQALIHESFQLENEEYLAEEPIEKEMIKPNFRKNIPHKQRRNSNEGKVISFYSWKGGVGKTTTAVNLATILQTYGDLSVGIIELTRQTGNILSHYPLIPTLTLKTWIEKKPTEKNALSMMLEDPATGLYILPSQTLLDHSKSPVQMEVKDALKMIHILKQVLDVVVIDAGTILDEFQFAIFKESDHVILVSDLSFETLKENHYMPEIIRKRNLDLDKFIHVINKVEKGLGVTVKDALEIVATPVSHPLPFRKEIMRKKEKREPFVLAHDRDKYTAELKLLVGDLFPEIEKLQNKPNWWKKVTSKVVGG